MFGEKDHPKKTIKQFVNVKSMLKFYWQWKKGSGFVLLNWNDRQCDFEVSGPGAWPHPSIYSKPLLSLRNTGWTQ